MSTICGESNYVYYVEVIMCLLYVEEVMMSTICGESNYVYYVEKVIMSTICGESNYVYYMWRK